MKLALYGIAFLGCCTVANADADKVKTQFVYALGDILASEQYCGLTYDPKTMTDYISKNVPATDISFTTRLTNAVSAFKTVLEEKSASEKIVHCTHINNVAMHYHFIK